ncbi:DUF2235 domain-containing protein [Coralloluteibacterium stylophorae]|uniref:DUF2235 domain-containing protein n=1 Tax=Coralloluteibacterium stylophorae TaxID=1776034 RepID=A0A8J8AWZ8_9GAMM|nr:DUF2235 domain-containing protein [Coralloluteibacterium stylophorae]MBS7456975.1 DUF2235 domain-containing protein [Coralloluteibacterium stylophorae]
MKRLAIFCDGTWNSADQAHEGVPCPTNVVKLAFRVAKRDAGMPQVVHYGQGVGTGNSVDRLTGGAFGDGLIDNIHAAYRFLVANYEPGDELYFFGFSRGAFTARSLVGMIRKCGILERGAVGRYADATALYRSDAGPDDADPLEFRRSCAIGGTGPVAVKFIGVWDTVGALGIPLRGLRGLTRGDYAFHDVELSGIVEHAYQALAIDERRAPFEAARWAYKPKPGQTVQQMWFCGAHSDVGGGYPKDEWGLSDLALEWMLGKARAVGLELDAAATAAYPARPDPTATLHDSRTGMYRLTPGIDRVIGLAAQPRRQPDRDSTEPDPTQDLHPSVRARWDAMPGYRPKNLRDYFRRIGDPRGG